MAGPARDALAGLARLGADAFGHAAELGVDRRLAEILRLRVAQINGCGYCLELHHRVARAEGIPLVVVDTLDGWWETDLHDPTTRAALDYVEALTRIGEAAVARDFQARHDALAEHLSDEQVIEIVGIALNMNVWTRLKVAEGAARRGSGEAETWTR